MDKALKNIAIYVLIVLLALFAMKLTNKSDDKVSEISEPQFYTQVEKGQIKTAKVEAAEEVYNITGELQDGSKYKTTVAKETDIIRLLREKKVDFSTHPVPPPSIWMTLLTTLFPIIILIVFLLFIMNQTQGGGGRVMQFGKSKARLMTGEEVKVTFKDVAGAEEAKEEMAEVVEFLKSPQKFLQMGPRFPGGSCCLGHQEPVKP